MAESKYDTPVFVSEEDVTVETIKKMKPYRKKPLVIKAVQINKHCVIHTFEGTMKAAPGDYIIQGVHGELYPCKPDIFEETYEKVE